MIRHTSPETASGHVLMISAHFAPENVSGTHRPLHFARSLVDAGIGVDIVTVTPDRMQAIDATLLDIFPFSAAVHRIRTSRTPADIYLALARRRRAKGPSAATSTGRQSASSTAGTSSILRRLISQLDVFPDPYASWRRPATRAAIALGRERQTALVFASGPPWTALRVGAAAARRLQVPFLADFRDPWTRRTGAHAESDFRVLRILAHRWEEAVMREAQTVLFNSPGVAEAATAGYPEVPASAFRVIVNGADVPRRDRRVPIRPEDPVRFSHFGTLYQGRSLDPLLTALTPVTGRPHRDGALDVELYGVSEWQAPARLPANVRVTAAGTLTHSDAVARMREPTVLVLVQPERFNRQIPTKLFEYLCTGNPVLVIASGDSAAWQIAREFDRCRLLDPGASGVDADVVGRLVHEWRDGLLWQEITVEDTRHLTKQAVGRKFVDVVEGLLGR